MDATAAVNVARQELYDRVWAEPVSRACKTFGLSDVGLAKICAAWAIPRPPRGYWAKLQSGQRVRAAKLKPIPEGDPVVLTYRPQPGPPPPDPDQPPTAADLQRAFENRPENRIVVPAELTDPHPLVERTAASLRAARPDEHGLARPKARGCLDVAVSPTLIDRAVRLLDALVNALDARGFTVSVGGDPPRTAASVLGETVGLRVTEGHRKEVREPTPAERKEDEWKARHPSLYGPPKTRHRLVPDGRLAVELTDGYAVRRRWSDPAGRRAEGCLNSVVVGVVRAAVSIHDQRAEVGRRRREAEERERQWREAERRRVEEEQRRREEQARFARLEAQAAAWARAAQLRAFVAAVRATADARGGVIGGSDLERWFSWAEEKAAALDPIPQLLGPVVAEPTNG